jgi:hypothetical protein
MARKRSLADDRDMLAVPSHRSYHLPLRILAGSAASALVVLLAAIQGI